MAKISLSTSLGGYELAVMYTRGSPLGPALGVLRRVNAACLVFVLIFLLQIRAALFMCLQRDPGVRVSSLNLWKFMAASADTNSGGVGRIGVSVAQ